MVYSLGMNAVVQGMVVMYTGGNLEKERYHIQRLGTFTKTGHGYNMTLGGDGVFGFEFSEETKRLYGGSRPRDVRRSSRAGSAETATRVILDRDWCSCQDLIPAAFMPGLTGQLYRQFALVIAATAFISAINAVTLKNDAKRVMAATADPG